MAKIRRRRRQRRPPLSVRSNWGALPPGLDPTFRPVSYFKQPSVEHELLAAVDGQERRNMVQAAVDKGRLGDARRMGKPLASDERKLLFAIHPAFLGGEFLPPRRYDEVEIARIVLHSVTQDVCCIRARQTASRIHYRVVDEYMDHEDPFVTPGFDKRTSIRPLTTAGIASLFERAWSLIGVLDRNFNSEEALLEDRLGFFRAESNFYPQLDALYRCWVRLDWQEFHMPPEPEEWDEDDTAPDATREASGS